MKKGALGLFKLELSIRTPNSTIEKICVCQGCLWLTSKSPVWVIPYYGCHGYRGSDSRRPGLQSRWLFRWWWPASRRTRSETTNLEVRCLQNILILLYLIHVTEKSFILFNYCPSNTQTGNLRCIVSATDSLVLNGIYILYVICCMVGRESSAGELIYLTVCPPCGPGSIPDHGWVF